MSKVYQSAQRFFLGKALRELQPAWFLRLPNMLLRQEELRAEELGLIDPRVTHRWLKPVAVILQVVRHCNYRCKFCLVNELVSDGDGATGITVEAFQRLMDAPLLSGCLRLGLTGGEPMLVPHVFELVRIAKRRIPVVTMNTNFSLVKPKLEQLNASGIDMLSISLYEPNQGLIKKLAPQVSPRIYRRLTFMLNQQEAFHHVRRIPEIAEMAVELGFKSLHFQNFLPPRDGFDLHSPRSENEGTYVSVARDNPEYLRLREETERRFGDRLAIAWPVFEDAVAPTGRPRCRQPDTQIAMDLDGNLAPCCQVDADPKYGNAHSPEHWNSEAFQAVRRGLKVEGAPLHPVCEGCPFVHKDLYEA